MPRKRNTGGTVEVRHQRSCATDRGKRCNCTPSYRAAVRVPGEPSPRRKTFASEAEALAWNAEMSKAKNSGRLARVGATQTLAEAAERTFAAMRRGTVLNRNRQRYKLNVVQNYEAAF